jgi:hypothetical protein
MSANDSCEAFFPAEPDIAGVGIQISFYVTILLLAFITAAARITTRYNPSTVAALVMPTAGLQGLVLLITAVIQTSHHQLSLYHAFIIFHLLAFLGIRLGSSDVLNDVARWDEDYGDQIYHWHHVCSAGRISVHGLVDIHTCSCSKIWAARTGRVQ